MQGSQGVPLGSAAGAGRFVADGIESSAAAIVARLRTIDAQPGLAGLSGALLALVGLAAVLRTEPAQVPLVVAAVAGGSVALGASLMLRGRLAVIGAVLALFVTTISSAGMLGATPTVIWLYAFVVPVIGLIHGPRIGALGGALAAPALHWIETGVAIEPFDPQTPFGILILVLLGAAPAHLLRLATRRRELLDAQLVRAEGLVIDADRSRQAEAAARQQAVFMLARAAEARDGTTGVHIEHVRDLAADLARAAGVPEAEIEHIAWSAMLHDVGKIRVPDRILLKPGALDADEWALIREHPRWGEELLQGDEGFALARQIARWHHEDWDGAGYPDGLRGAAIPLPARIVRVVDVYDALRSERPYKPAWSVERTLDELRSMRGRGLDPDLTDVFIERHPG
jgi:HD domain